MSKVASRATSVPRPRHPSPDPRIRDLIAPRPAEDYFTYGWLLLFATYGVMTLIFFLFTPYTHQLDEIKNMLLMSAPPFLFAAAIAGKDFRSFSWRTHASTILLGWLIVEMLVSWLLNPPPQFTGKGVVTAIYEWLTNPMKLTSERVVWFQLACMTFTIVFAWYLDSEAKLRKTMVFYVLMALASVLIGLFLYAGRGFTDAMYEAMKRSKFWSPQAKNLVLTLATSKEMYSTILNSDFYAAYLVMTLPIPLSMFFVEKRPLWRALAATTFLLMNVCLVFTNSNDSFMSMVFISYPLYFLLAWRHFRKVNISGRLLATFTAGSLVLFLTVFVLMLPKLSQTWDFKAAALEGRKILWSGGFWPWLYRDDPTKSHLDLLAIIFGTGPGGYRFYFPVFRRPDFFDNQINNVTTFGHNYYLDYLLEFGLLGLGLFLAFHGRVLYDAVRQTRRSTNEVYSYYQIALVAGLSGVALQNFFSPNNRWAVCGMIYWSLFGLSMGIHQLEHGGDESESATRGSSLSQIKRAESGTAAPRASLWAAMPGMAKTGAWILAIIFLMRSTPQGFDHFRGAMEHGLGLTYMELADYREDDKLRYLELAKEHFLKAIALNPTFASSYYKIAHVYNQLGEVDSAIKAYEALDRVFPHYSEIHLNLGIMYSVKALDLEGVKKLEALEKAYDQIKEAARQELKPNVQWIAGMIGKQLIELYESANDSSTSPALANELRKRNPDNKRVEALRRELKTYYKNILSYEPRLEELRVERKKYYERAQRELVTLAILTGDYREAEQLLTQIYNEDPSRVEYLAQLLALYDKQGKQKEKIAFLENAVHGAPTDLALRQILAEAYQDAKDQASYLKELRRIEVLDPKNKFALTNLLKAYRDAGNTQKVDEYSHKVKAIGLDPQAVLGQRAKASSGSAESLADVEQALAKIEEAKTTAAGVAATTLSSPTARTTLSLSTASGTTSLNERHPTSGALAGDPMGSPTKTR